MVCGKYYKCTASAISLRLPPSDDLAMSVLASSFDSIPITFSTKYLLSAYSELFYV